MPGVSPASDGTKFPSRQLRHQTVYFEVRISEEHLHILMTGDEGDFRDRQPHLKEPADGFMTQVVKAEVVERRAAPKTNPSQPEGVSVDREGVGVSSGSLLLENRYSLGREWYFSAASVLSQRQEGCTALQVDITPR